MRLFNLIPQEHLKFKMEQSEMTSCCYTKFILMAHNWQKWKSRFLHCRQIYRVEAVVLKMSNYTFKITIFMSIWNLGPLRWKLIFSQSFSITAEGFQNSNLKILLHICDAYIIVINHHHHISFLLNQFFDKYRFSLQILRFYRKITYTITKRSVTFSRKCF